MTLETLRIKPLTEKELTQVLSLDNICFGGLWSLDAYRREIESPNSCLLVLTSNECAQEKVIGIGCFWAILDEAHITILAIHPDWQGQGLGKLLLQNLLVKAQERELTRATLEVAHSNHKAISLYESFDFVEAGRRKRYYQKTGEDAIVFWKKLV